MVNVTYEGDLFYEGVDAKGAIEKHPSALADAYESGRKLAEKLKVVAEGTPWT